MKSLVLFLLTTLLAVVSADPCGNSPNQTYTSISQVFDFLSNSIFQYNKLNAGCISAGCPQLSTNNVCPVNSDHTLNALGVNQSMIKLGQCFSSSDNLCGTSFKNYYYPAVTLKLSPFPILLCIANNSAQFSNVANTTFTIINSQLNPASITVQVTNPGMFDSGNVTVQFSNRVLNVPLPHFGSVAIRYVYQVNLSSSPPTYTISSTSVQPSFPTGQSTIIDNSAKTFGNYIVGALQTIQSNCVEQQP